MTKFAKTLLVIAFILIIIVAVLIKISGSNSNVQGTPIMTDVASIPQNPPVNSPVTEQAEPIQEESGSSDVPEYNPMATENAEFGLNNNVVVNQENNMDIPQRLNNLEQTKILVIDYFTAMDYSVTTAVTLTKSNIIAQSIPPEKKEELLRLYGETLSTVNSWSNVSNIDVFVVYATQGTREYAYFTTVIWGPDYPQEVSEYPIYIK